MTHILINAMLTVLFYSANSASMRNGRRVEVDSRPSDAIALAVRVHCPIYVEEDVIKRAGVALERRADAEDIVSDRRRRMV